MFPDEVAIVRVRVAERFVPSVNCTLPIVPVADADPDPLPVPTACHEDEEFPEAIYIFPNNVSMAIDPVAVGLIVPSGVP